MKEVASIDPQPASRLYGNRVDWREMVLPLAVVLLVVYAYFINRVCLFQVSKTSLFNWLWISWSRGADYVHGFFVPPLAVALMYWRWNKKLRGVPMTSSKWGLAFIGTAMVMYIFGARGQLNQLIAISLVILSFGVVLYLGGWVWLQELWFPCALLSFMIPLDFLDEKVGFPLRLFVAETSSHVLNLFGLDVYNSGTGIHSASKRFASLEVANPCSGIRSLEALMTLTALYGYLAMDKAWKKWVLFLSSIPLAVIGNLARIMTMVLVSLGFGSDSATKVHNFSGFIVFSLAILCMLGLGTLLNLHYRDILNHWMQEEAPPAPVPRKVK